MKTKYIRSSNFVGKDVFTRQPINTGDISIPKGTFGRIMAKNGDTLQIKLNKCYCCGVQPTVWLHGKHLEFTNGITEEELCGT